MLKRIPHGLYATVFSTVFLVVALNALLAIACLPFLIVLMTTDPSLSWPMLAVTAAMCAPALTASFSVFRAHKDGENRVVRPFLRAIRATWRRSLLVGFLAASVVVVAAVDVFVLVPTEGGAFVAPLLVVVACLAFATGAIALVAISEAPDARLRDLLRVSALLGVRRWYLTGASLAVVGVQAGILIAAPALGIGITAAACLYVVWAGSRHTLQPALLPAASAAAA